MFNVFISKRVKKFIVFLILFLTIIDFVWAEEKYNPYPIVFVHGYNNVRIKSKDDLWRWTTYNFKKFFEYHPTVTSTEFKYWHKDWGNYMSVFDYRTESNGDLDEVADKLGKYINDILDKLPDNQEQKVIIVAHSAGGIVTRRLLAKNSSYQNKIERVIFIGTPHLGSPLASGVILTDRMIPELERAENDDFKGAVLDMGLLKGFTHTWAWVDRHKQISSALSLFNTVVNWDVKVSIEEMLAGNPKLPEGQGGRYKRKASHNQGQGVTVGQLVVPQTVKATKTFIGKAMLGPFTMAETEEAIITKSSYGQGETFLYNNTFARPNKFKIIEGTGSLGAWIMGKLGGALFKSLASYSGLPNGQSFDDVDNGDGIVTSTSQTALGGEIYQVNRSHITEVNAWETILKAIDDKPVIEDVRVVTSFSPNGNPDYTYVIIKAKDYLLADIEFETSIRAKNLSDYYSYVTFTYKPFHKFKKEFLHERDDPDVRIRDINGDVTSLHLLPGEFYLRLKGTLLATAYPYDYIKIKNPSSKVTECWLYPPTGAFATFKYVATATSLSYYPIYPPDFIIPPGYPIPQWHAAIGDWAVPYSEFRAYAYNSFLVAPYFSTDDNVHPPGDTQGRGISANIHGYGWWSVLSYNNGYATSANRTLIAYMENLNFINFPVDTSGNTIRTAKLIGYIDKKLEGGGADFNIFLYRDSTNTWPASQNSSGDIPLFSINTSLYQDGAYFEAAIDPTNINPNGNNVWQTRSDLLDFALHNNFLPQSIPYDLSTTFIGSSWADFKRSAYIKNPVLIVIYE